MGQSAEGVTVDTLQHVNRWFLREDTIKAANAALIHFHHRLPISRIWGEGILFFRRPGSTNTSSVV